MRLLKSALFCLAPLITATAQIYPSTVDVSIFGISAKVHFEGNYWFDENIIINSKGEWISDKYRWVQGKDYGWNPEPLDSLAPSQDLPIFNPKPLFDDDPKTAIGLPLQIPYYEHCMDEFLIITFEKPQTIDAFLIRPGNQKDITSFKRFDLPTSLAIELHGEDYTQEVFGTMPMDGKVTRPNSSHQGRKINAYPILKPLANFKNMSERLIMLDRPYQVKSILISLGMLDNPAYVMQGFKPHKQQYVRAYISDLLPVFTQHPTGNKLRDGLIDVMRKLRGNNLNRLKNHDTLQYSTINIKQDAPQVTSLEAKHESSFRSFKTGFFPTKERQGSIRLAYRNGLLWSYGNQNNKHNTTNYPVMITDESGEVIDAWERDNVDANELP